MENKTNISALEELVNSEIRNYEKNHTEIDNDILQQNIWMTVESYYESDQIPTKEELEYLDKLELNFTEFTAHYEVVTLDAPDGEICTSRSHKGVAAEPEAAKLKAIQVNKCFISGSIFFSLDSCEDR